MKSYLNAKLILFKKNLKANSNIICDNNIAKLIRNKVKKKYKFVLQSKNNSFKIIGFKTSRIKNKTEN